MFLVFIVFFFNTILLVKSNCPNGSIASSSSDSKSCYFYEKQKMNYMVAEQYCIGLGGKLVSIHDMFDNFFISGQASIYFTDSTSIDFWIGANNLYKPGIWTWMDATPFDFSDWNKGEPKNTTGSNCSSAKIQGGQWMAVDCFMNKSFVCNIKVTPEFSPTTTIKPVPTTCQPSWTYYVVNGTTGYCYKVLDNATWIDAENMCKVEYAHLASVHTLDEALFLAYLAHTPGYKGDCNGFKMAWIGGYTDDNNAHWYWTDGTPFNYTAWPGGLDHPFSSLPRSCTLKYLTAECGSSAATFDNFPCDRLLAKYICKKSPQ